MRSSPVTFLIPAFNVRPYLQGCLEGLYAQTFADYEALIINDGSNDGTEEVLRQIKDPRFRIIHQRENKGYINCLNMGLSMIMTRFTARLDADDIPGARRLEMQLRFLDANPQVSVVGSRMGYIFGAKEAFRLKILGKTLIPSFCPRMQEPPFWDPVTDGETIPHSSATFRTEDVKRAGCYRDLYPAEDLDLWYRLAARGAKMACLPEILTLYRINPSGATSSSLARQAMVTEFVNQSLSQSLKGQKEPSWQSFAKNFHLSPKAKQDLEFKGLLRRAMAYFLGKQYIPAGGIIFKIMLLHPVRLARKIMSRIFILR